MIKFNRLLPSRMYRIKDKYSLPFIPENMYKGALITIFGKSMDDTRDFFKRQYISPKYYNRYYLQKKLYTEFLGMPVRIINDQKKVFEENFAKNTLGFRLSLTPSMTQGFNVVYETGQYMTEMFKNEKIIHKPMIQRSNIYNTYIMKELKNIELDFATRKKFLYLPIDEYINKPNSPSIWVNKQSKYNNLLLSFLRQMDTDPAFFKKNLPGWTFIFVNVNELFYINTDNMGTTDDYTNIKKLFIKFRSKPAIPSLVELDDDELVGADDDEVIEKINNKNIGDAKAEISHILNNTKSLSDIKDKVVSNIKITTEPVAPKTVSKPKLEDKKSDIIEEPKKKNIVSGLITKQTIEDEETDKSSSAPLISKDEIETKVKESLKKEIDNKILPKKSPRLARIDKIQKEMSSIKVDNRSIYEIIKEAESKVIDDHKIKADVINENMKNIKFDNFEKGYNKKLLEYDLTNILTSFSKMDRPLYLISINKEDVSNITDQLYTYTAIFEDEKGLRHTLKFDLPKFVNNKFIHINGSDKLFINQLLPLPISKVNPDTVQVSSNYNKVFIKRFGKAISAKIDKFNKAIGKTTDIRIRTTKGNNVIDNTEFPTTMEYDELSAKFTTIEITSEDIIAYFNQSQIRSECSRLGLEYDESTEYPFAIETLPGDEFKLICINIESDTLSNDPKLSPIDYIINKIGNIIDGFNKEFMDSSTSKRMVYTRAKIMNKQVPIVLLLSYLIGFTELLDKLGVSYEFSDTKPRLGEESIKKSIIEFKDGYLTYSTYPLSNSLIINGMGDIPTQEYNFLEFSGKDIYYDIFNRMFGRRNIAVAFDNFNQLFVDPITKEILDDMKIIPNDFVSLIIYANSLLENNTFDLDGEMKNYRIRSNELVNAHLYKILAKQYERYRSTADNRNPEKFSVKQKSVINDMFDSQIMEEYSTLNPIYEIDRMRTTSYKGPGGCNVDKAFSISKRAYNSSMLGILAQSSPVSANIGISRILSLNPNVKSLRGYLDAGSDKDLKTMDSTKLLSGAELLLPGAATHDDPQRVSMASSQSRHTISTIESDPALFGYGMDRTISHIISDRFAFKAKEDGYVLKVDKELGYMLLKYKNGETDVVDITDRQALNTGSGIYITNRLSPNLSEGTKFKSEDIVACNEDFFQYDELTHNAIYKSGPIARIALIHGSCVFEDSTKITERLADRMSTYITETRDITIGKNSNIYKMAQMGEEVRVGDPLLVFDESYSDDYLNKLVEKMNEDNKQDIIEAGRTPIKSKWNGNVVGIKIYYTVPKEELSTSIQEIINKFEEPIIKRQKAFTENGVNIKDLVSLNEMPEHIVPVNGKIEGVPMRDNHVFIRFFVRDIDRFSTGDKLTYQVALKGITQSLIPKGKEPYLVSDPSIKIDGLLSISGYYSRMTNSAPISMAINNTIIGMHNKILDIFDNKKKG